MKKEQLETFNDAVIAIVITLMVLEIKVTDLSRAGVYSLLQQILIYSISFVVISIVWLNLRAVLAPIEWVANRLIWCNLCLLFTVSLIPLPTREMGERFHEVESHVFFGIVLGTVSLVFTLLHVQISYFLGQRRRHDVALTVRKNWLATSLYLLSIPLAYVSIYFSTAIFVVLPILYFLPSTGQPKTEAES